MLKMVYVENAKAIAFSFGGDVNNLVELFDNETGKLVTYFPTRDDARSFIARLGYKVANDGNITKSA